MKHLKFLLIIGFYGISVAFAQQGAATTVQPHTGSITHKTVNPPAGMAPLNTKTNGVLPQAQTPKPKPQPGEAILPGTKTTGNAPKR